MYVVNPGVNTSEFDPNASKLAVCHPKIFQTSGGMGMGVGVGMSGGAGVAMGVGNMGVAQYSENRCLSPCPVIGFLARLASEKSPGPLGSGLVGAKVK